MACYSLKPINNFWKLDKIDKIGISIILVFFAIFSIFDCFCFASEDEIVTGVPITGVVGSFDEKVFVSDRNVRGIYFEAQPGYDYTLSITDDGSYYNLWISDVIPEVGNSYISNIGMGGNNRKYSFTPTTGQIVYVLSTTYGGDISHVTMVRKANSYNGVINDLVSNVGLNNIWSVFEISIPYIYIVVLVGIGFYFIFHAIREMSKGRDI